MSGLAGRRLRLELGRHRRRLTIICCHPVAQLAACRRRLRASQQVIFTNCLVVFPGFFRAVHVEGCVCCTLSCAWRNRSLMRPVSAGVGMQAAIRHGGVSDPTRKNKPPSGTTATRTRRVARHWTDRHKRVARGANTPSPIMLSRACWEQGREAPIPTGRRSWRAAPHSFLTRRKECLAERARRRAWTQGAQSRETRRRASLRAL